MKDVLVDQIREARAEGMSWEAIEKVIAEYGFSLTDYRDALIKRQTGGSMASNVEPSQTQKKKEYNPRTGDTSQVTIKITKFLMDRGRDKNEIRLWKKIAPKLTKIQKGCVFKHIMLDFKLAKKIDESVQLDEIKGLGTFADDALKGFMTKVTGKTGIQMMKGLETATINSIKSSKAYRPIIDFIMKQSKSPIPRDYAARFVKDMHKANKLTSFKTQDQIASGFKKWAKANPVPIDDVLTGTKKLKTAADVAVGRATELKKLDPGMFHKVLMSAKRGAASSGKKAVKQAGAKILKHKKKLMGAAVGGGALAIWMNAQYPCNFDEIRKIMAEHGVEMRVA